MNMCRTTQRCETRGSARNGFSLIELLVVIAIIAILAAILLPVLSSGKEAAQNAACLNNLRQLEMCCHTYAVDYNDFLPPNQVGGKIPAPSSTNSPSIVTNVSWCPGHAPLDATTTNVQAGLIYPYNNSPGIYHCPADISTVLGYPILPRTRSYCMDISLYCDDTESTFKRFTEIRNPSPANLFVFIDTQEQDIWDATFGMFGPGSYYAGYWLDLPADRHSQGANLSFADGHVEHWHWKVKKVYQGSWWPAYSPADLADLQRLEQFVKPNVN